MRQNCLKKMTKKIKRRSSGVKSENILRSKKSKVWPLVSTSLISQKKKKRCDISEIKCFNYDKKDHFANDYTKPKN